MIRTLLDIVTTTAAIVALHSSKLTYAYIQYSPSCPCIDVSTILARHSNCVMENGQPGFVNGYDRSLRTVNVSCYPITYGSDVCDMHDIEVDPHCSPNATLPIPDYCEESWCYVDRSACKRSKKNYFQSDYFDELYYSYSTCNSSEDAWDTFKTTNPLEQKNLEVTIPGIVSPIHYKFDQSNNGEIAKFDGEEYYDDTIPWQGWHLDYFRTVVDISNMGNMTYTHHSGGSIVESPDSSWTAVVLDIQAKRSCVGLSSFWITAERLQLATFTAPVTVEKLYLFVRNPGWVEDKHFLDNLKKIFMPFSTGLWICFLCVLILFSVSSVVFASEHGDRVKIWRQKNSTDWKKASLGKRAKIFSRLSAESLLDESTNACNQASIICDFSWNDDCCLFV